MTVRAAKSTSKAYDPCSAGCVEELWKRRLARLVFSQRPDEGIAIERGHVAGAGHERRALREYRAVLGKVKGLARG